MIEQVAWVLGGIEFDPCADRDPKHQFAEMNWSSQGLDLPWPNASTYVNPPFSQLKKWAEKARKEFLSTGQSMVFLCASRTDTKAWQDNLLAVPGALVFLLRGRLTFRGGATVAPFPVALTLFSNSEVTRKRFVVAFKGHCVQVVS